MELPGQGLCNQAASPLIKIAEHDSRAPNVHRFERIASDEPRSLLAAFQVSRTQVRIEHVQQVRSQPDIGSEHAALFSTRHAEIYLLGLLESPTAQSHVAVNSSEVFARFAN